MGESFLSTIDAASSILILLPTKPYFDQVAAALSLYLSVSDRKPTSISCPSPMTVNFNRLIGINKISAEVGNKNLVITFPGYNTENIEKVSYDIIDGEFKLTVVPKSGRIAPQKDQVGIVNSGLSADLVILVGGANESHFPMLTSKDLEGANIAHIGVRMLDVVSGKNVMSFASPASSVSELVANLIKETGLTLDADSATNLVMGIEEGSGHFEGSDVTPSTFETFAFLLRNGGQRPPKMVSPGAFPPGSIPGRPIANLKKNSVPIVQPMQHDIEGTKEEEQAINPPSDWLEEPKIYRGGANVPQTQQPQVPSENKG